MTASKIAAPKVVAPAPVESSPVKQWFRGEIEASYYGIRSLAPAASSDSIGRRYRLHIYRLAMLRAEPIDSPDAITQSRVIASDGTSFDAQSGSGTQASEPFFQASVQIAQLWGVRGIGTRYEGPIHDLSITQPQTRFHVVKDGKSYGTLRGFAQGWLYLPPNTVAPEPTLPAVEHSDQVTPGVLIHESLQDNVAMDFVIDKSAPAVDRQRAPNKANAESDARDVSVDDKSPARPRRVATSQGTEPPYFSLCAAVGLLLWFTCGAEQTWIWCVFMLPTLGMRRLVLEVLPDERGVQAFAAVMVLGAVLSAGTILASFGSQNCWKLDAVPLVALVASVFLSAIVPYRLPLAITAVAFAAVLFMWGYAPERHCLPEVPTESLPTIKDPGVPRTNDDGTWPRRVPSSEGLLEEK